MKEISIVKNNLKLVFSINDNGKINYSYLGDLKTNFIKDSRNNINRNIVEIETREENHGGNHCEKFSQTPYGINSRYVSHSINDNELVIVTSDNRLTVETHYVFYENCDGFSIYNVVKNISNENRILEYVSTFYLYGFGNDTNPICDNMVIHKGLNSWHTEAQWKHCSFLSEGIYNANAKVSMQRYQINNTGSWSTQNYLPMVGIEDTCKGLLLLGQIENNGSWHIEVSDNQNEYYLSMSGPEYTDNNWAIRLKPSETFVTCKASVVISRDFEGSIQQMTLLRRNLLPNDSLDQKELPIIYNDFMHARWDNQEEGPVLALVDKAKEAGAEVFVIDAGWFFPGCGWTDFIGNWREAKENYPTGGLSYVFDYIRKKGMKVGIWVEIENMGLKCPILNTLPKDFFFSINGVPVIRNNRYCLNFDNPKAYAWALEELTYIVKTYNIDYLKNDYNLSSGAGTDNGYLTPGEGLLKHNRALIKLLKELQSRFPNLTIESCASGGLRMDYEMLKVCPIQSTSDQEEFDYYPFIASNIFTAVTPEQAGIWSYPVNCRNKTGITDEMVITNMVNSSLARIHLASVLEKLSPNQMELVKEATDLYKANRDVRKNGLPVFPNGSSFFYDDSCCVGLVNDKEMWLAVWCSGKEAKDIAVDLSKYNPKELSILYPKKVETKYTFDKENNKLIFSPKERYSARLFKVLLK